MKKAKPLEQASFDQTLFREADEVARQKATARRIAEQKEFWKICWGWTPHVGHTASFGDCVAVDTTGKTHYVYAARCIIRELTETDCLVEYVEVLDGDPCDRHGHFFRLTLDALWVDVDLEFRKRGVWEALEQLELCHWNARSGLLIFPLKHEPYLWQRFSRFLNWKPS